MSINELEMKCRELRQLQALIDEAQAEAETIKDAIKAAMGTQEAVQAGEYKRSRGSPSQRPDWILRRLKRPCRRWPRGSQKKPPSAASLWHDRGRGSHRWGDISHGQAVCPGSLD